MHLSCLQSWSTALLEEMEHYVFCSRLSSLHSGFTIPWIMAVYTQRCLIYHSVEVDVCVCWGWGRCTRSQKGNHPLTSAPPPYPFCPFKEKLMFTQFSLNECFSRHVLLWGATAAGGAAAATPAFTILSADRWKGVERIEKYEWQICGIFIRQLNQVC